MKKITLNIYNYGNIAKVASFGNNQHDAYICLRSLNDNQVAGHGYLPADIFYFMEFTRNKKVCLMVDYTNPANDFTPYKFTDKVKSKREVLLPFFS